MAISATEIIKATCISQIKNNKACGLDLITNEMMKASANILSPCFQKLFNTCLNSGKYPTCWAE